MLTSLLKKKRSHKNPPSLPPFAPKEFYPPLLSSIPKCTSSRPLDNQTYFAARRVDDIKISKSEGGEGIFLPSLAGEPRWNIFRRGARPIKFARPRRAIIHGVPRATRLPPFFRNPLPPLFLAPTFSRLHARLIGKDCVSLGWPRAPTSRSIYHRDVHFSLFLRFGVAFSGSSYSLSKARFSPPPQW